MGIGGGRRLYEGRGGHVDWRGCGEGEGVEGGGGRAATVNLSDICFLFTPWIPLCSLRVWVYVSLLLCAHT